MDVGSPIRQPAPGPLPGQFYAAPQQAQAVATELPKPLAVDTAELTPDVRLDLNPTAERRARIESQAEQRRKQFVIDEASKDMVVRTLDAESGKVIAQYPDDWQLKQRAYARAMIEKQFMAQMQVDRAGEFSAPVERAI